MDMVLSFRNNLGPINKAGAINFSIHGYDYPILNKKIPSLLIQPNDGEIVLFPSSLFHSTILINKNRKELLLHLI